MSVDEFIALFPDYEFTNQQLAAVCYCEQVLRQRFLVDFGFANAESIMDRHFREITNEIQNYTIQ